MDKPRILWIDDVYGRAHNGRNRDRYDLCSRLGLQDITGDCLSQEELEPKSKPLLVFDDREINEPVDKENPDDEVIADVIFSQGQVETSDDVINDLGGTLEIVRSRWEHPRRLGLLLLDMHFATGTIGADGELLENPEDSVPEKYFGLTILDSLWRDSELRDIPVVITSGMERNVIERRFATQGVWAFVDKIDLDKAKLKELLDDYGLLTDDKIIGHSLPLLQCLREARRRARIPNENVIILGESGTEQELLAEYIHQQSGREGDYFPFSYVSEETLETKLSDAAVFADGGTLFIDKFDDIIAAAQPKLLQLLKNIHNQNLGVITAIEREEIRFEDDFRQALPAETQIHNVIRVPTLGQRSEDIPELVKYFVKKYEEAFDAEPRKVSDEAFEALRAYPWPGNVRELEGVIRHAVFTYKELRWLEANHLELPSHETHTPPIPPNQPNSSDLFKVIIGDELWKQFGESLGEMAPWLQDMALWVLTEKALRGAITTILSGQIGTDWIDSVRRMSPKLEGVFKACQKRQDDYSDYPGENRDLPDLINFTAPRDLFDIILRDDLWNDHFREFFGANDSTLDVSRKREMRAQQDLTVRRVRNLMYHSNPDLIRSYDRVIFKEYCGQILKICQKIETDLSERGQQLESELSLPNDMDLDPEGTEQEKGEQEELYEGTVWSFHDDNRRLEIDEHSTLQVDQHVWVPKCNFKSEETFNCKNGTKVKFKIEKIGQNVRVYDVVLAEPK